MTFNSAVCLLQHMPGWGDNSQPGAASASASPLFQRTKLKYPAAILLDFLQDMPGWGDDINLVNSLKTVLDFLLKQRQKDYIRNKAGLTGERGGVHGNQCLQLS